MGKINLVRLGRKTRNTMRKIGSIVRKGASIVRGIIGNVDKASGGQLSRMISSDPRGALLMSGVNQLADKNIDIEGTMRNKFKRVY
jgi:hypothetical protein